MYEVGNFVGYTIQFLNLRAVSASLGVRVFKSTSSGPCTVPKFIPWSPFRCLQNQAAALRRVIVSWQVYARRVLDPAPRSGSQAVFKTTRTLESTNDVDLFA